MAFLNDFARLLRTVAAMESTARSITRAEKRERARRAQPASRSLAQIRQEAREVLRKASTFESWLEKDVIKALALSYSKSRGFSSRAFHVRTNIYSVKLGLPPANADEPKPTFNPPVYQVGKTTIEPLHILGTRWATVIAFRIRHFSPNYTIRLNWVRKSDPAASRVVLHDRRNGESYYPISTDLKGPLLPGRSRVGLIAFQPFRMPTDSVEVRFLGVKLSSRRGLTHSFAFTSSFPSLPEEILESLKRPRLSEQIERELNEQVVRLKRQVGGNRSVGCFGLAVCLVLVGLLIVFFVAAN